MHSGIYYLADIREHLFNGIILKSTGITGHI